MKKNELLKALTALIAAAGISTAAGARTFTSGDSDSLGTEGTLSQMIELAANQQGQGADGNSGQGVGGSGPGNQGNDKGVGNAGYGG